MLYADYGPILKDVAEIAEQSIIQVIGNLVNIEYMLGYSIEISICKWQSPLHRLYMKFQQCASSSNVGPEYRLSD